MANFRLVALKCAPPARSSSCAIPGCFLCAGAKICRDTPKTEVDRSRRRRKNDTVVVTRRSPLVAIMVWGPRSAWAWIVAALSYEALGGSRNAVYGPEWQAQGPARSPFSSRPP